MLKKWVIVLVLTGIMGSVGQAQEVKFKALMLYQFTKLIGWPATSDDNAFVIGVYGDSRVYQTLSGYAQGKHVGARKIDVRFYNSANSIENCEILYIDASKSKYLPAIINKIGHNTSTLLVTDRRGALDYGAVVNFTKQEGYMKVELSQTNAYKRKLQISMQLVRAAVHVQSP